MSRIRMNYFWALLYNVILLPISAGVFYPTYHIALVPMLAGGAMALSSVSIVLSSLLLLLYTPPRLLGATQSVLRDIIILDPKGSRKAITVNLCNCPTSLAPILSDEGRSFTNTVRGVINSVRKKFTSNYSQLSPGSSTDSDEDSYSFVVPETVGDDDLEKCIVDDYNLSDVDKFIHDLVPHDDESGDFFSMNRSKVYKMHSNQHNIKLASLLSLRNRNIAKSMPSHKVHGCSCNKSNCRCGPQCQCGTRR